MILLLLSDFGQIPEAVKSRILAEMNPETLDYWILALKRAESLEQFISLAMPDRESKKT